MTDSVGDQLADLPPNAGPAQGSPGAICWGGGALRTGLAISRSSLRQWWGEYLALGGNNRFDDLISYLYDEEGWTAHEHNIAAQALNELCADLHLGRPVAYAGEIAAGEIAA